MKMFAVFDSKAKCYLTPFFLGQDGEAERVFGDCVNNMEHPWGRNPEDYHLYRIGEWDNISAKIEQKEMHKSLGNGYEYLIKEEIPAAQTKLNLVGGEKNEIS